MTAGPVCLRSPRLLSGVGAYFVLVGTSERLPTRTTRDVWSGTIRESSMESIGVLIGFSPAGCRSIRIGVTLGYEYRLFVAVST
jgi:hypothetical protein